MVRLSTILILLFGCCFTSSAQVLTLDSCIAAAYQNFSFAQQLELSNEITETNKKRIGKNYLPSLDLNAIGTYQNEQITIPVEIPIAGFEAPAAPLNLNSALFSLRQWIYDGSQTHYQKLMEDANGRIQSQELAVQQLELKTMVMQQYFTALLKAKQADILTEKETALEKRLQEADAAVENHLLLEADFNILKAEKLKLAQQQAEIRFSISENYSALAQLTGIDFTNEAQLELPEVEMSKTTDLNMRPDVQLLNRQMELLEAQKGLTKSNYLPRIGLFADGGLGLPGYDIFKDDIAPMAKVGISLNWRIFDWNKGSLQRQSLSLNQQILQIKQEQLINQVGVKTQAQLNAMEKAKALMQSDNDLVTLYNSVADAYAAQLENGTITAADYLVQLNMAQEARTNLELHQMQLLIATINYNTLIGE